MLAQPLLWASTRPYSEECEIRSMRPTTTQLAAEPIGGTFLGLVMPAIIVIVTYIVSSALQRRRGEHRTVDRQAKWRLKELIVALSLMGLYLLSLHFIIG
ncbi:hypothetical protein [Streptomyces sp. S1]|uniref:hypothetical protein n=1 Tax=Streptomyces sp. NPDC000961 TaxID=3364541 RepID=UPI000EF84A73